MRAMFEPGAVMYAERIGSPRRLVVGLMCGVLGAGAIGGCSGSQDSDAGPGTTSGTAASVGVERSSGVEGPVPLAVGELTVVPAASGVTASAPDADHCASAVWRVSGPVEYEQAAPVPEGCWEGAHAFDTSWYNLSLPPGDYVISIDVRRGDAVGSSSAEFTITG